MQATSPPPTLRGPPVKFNLERMVSISIKIMIMIQIRETINYESAEGDTNRSMMGELVRM